MALPQGGLPLLPHENSHVLLALSISWPNFLPSTYQYLKWSYLFSCLPHFHCSPLSRMLVLSILFSSACPSFTILDRYSKNICGEKEGKKEGQKEGLKGWNDISKATYAGSGRTEPSQSELFYGQLSLRDLSGGLLLCTTCIWRVPRAAVMLCSGPRPLSSQPPICELAGVGDSWEQRARVQFLRGSTCSVPKKFLSH